VQQIVDRLLAMNGAAELRLLNRRLQLLSWRTIAGIGP
jgi:hypothetical protein